MAKVTLSGTASFVQSTQWTPFLSAVKEHLPLQNLHWKSATRPSIRTIQQLEIVLCSLDSSAQNAPPQVLILDQPLLHIYFLACDDVEVYKTTIRRQIQDWRGSIPSQFQQDWLIVLVSTPDAAAGNKKRFQMKGNVMDKLRADFNSDKRDRCAHLIWSSATQDPTLWADFVSRMKEGLVASIDTQITMREEELRRLENMRQTVNWTFNSFCIMKDALASSFISLDLLEDAQLQLDELEATYFQILKETGHSPISSFGGRNARNDSSPLLASEKILHRDGQITVFSFRTYLLSRQWHLLVRRHEFILAIEKAVKFIPFFSHSLRSAELGALHVESWVYSSCLNVLDHMGSWTNLGMDASDTKINWFKGTLYDLARAQLDKIGIACGHLSPSSTRFSSVPPLLESPTITQKDLLAAIGSKLTFDKLYIMITNRAIEAYTVGGGKRAALRLHTSLAILDSNRERLVDAFATFHSLPAHYSSTHWALLRGYLLTCSLSTRMSAEQIIDESWVSSALDFLACYVHIGQDFPASHFLIGEGTHESVVSSSLPIPLMPNIVAKLLTAPALSGQTVFEHPMIRPEWGTMIILESNPDKSSVQCQVHNMVTLPLSVDEVVLTMIQGPNGDEVLYQASSIVLKPGLNVFILDTLLPSPGVYSVTRLEVKFNAFTICYRADKSRSTEQPLLQRIERVNAPVNIQIEIPHRIELAANPTLQIVFHVGSQAVKELVLQFSDASNRMEVLYPNAVLTSEHGSLSLVAHDSLVMRNLPASVRFVVMLPFVGSLHGALVKVLSVGHCVLEDAPSTIRRLRKEHMIAGALPIVVNVQDVFRRNRLVWKFTISSDGHQYIRVLKASVISTSDDRVEATGLDSNQGEVVSPSSSMSKLIQISNPMFQKHDSDRSLRLRVQYRTLKEEISSRVKALVLKASPKDEPSAELIRTVFLRLLDDCPGWEEIYAHTSRVSLENSFASGDFRLQQERVHQLISELTNIDTAGQRSEGQTDVLAERLIQVEKALRRERDIMVEGDIPRRELILPLELPHVHVINAITSRLVMEKNALSGQPIQCVIGIRSTFNPPLKLEESCTMRYLIGDANPTELDSWLVSGASHGEFDASHNSFHEIKVTLIALRHGELMLPTVSVEPQLRTRDDSRRWTVGSEVYQERGAFRVKILPRTTGTTFTLTVPSYHVD